ncbi:MAG: hypothetical protein A2Y00_01775 [Omnitrophica WOR_2 bacterium GWF2_43_52]|nr:MAG: hypothetical protein A2Y01_02045 [Omnitrophica WOR_2 bacterium GWC2_44_8]OGX20083.1 MAG: hypothetical protein A2Y00_01775 [Omnitrophica WOR_2 bacterium GWF2_43_52]OGX58690.1 MAG: hypothetical protein A2460_07065 [Omnitrophica WOR_2 bacterium RIFOXYC2_FULL_43_9]HAH19693.1 hypothetical protein [Candidatus Omnitrophota bacterium]HBG64055.1 hypothetical protein [Candidatus Omnitrophota bacterium]
MRLIIDANILLAAFLKSAVTRELLFDDEIELFAPEYFAAEITRTIKKSKFLRLSAGLTKEEIEELLAYLFGPIKIMPKEKYIRFMEKAKQHMPEDDTPYLALAFSINVPIWSNDSAFKKQSLAAVYTTQELVKILGY